MMRGVENEVSERDYAAADEQVNLTYCEAENTLQHECECAQGGGEVGDWVGRVGSGGRMKRRGATPRSKQDDH
jgi:hypothetical protein